MFLIGVENLTGEFVNFCWKHDLFPCEFSMPGK